MNLLITPKEQILAELQNIDSFLNITMSENAEEAVQRGNDLAVYVARSGKLLADSKYWLNETMKSEVMQTLVDTAKNAKATATAINALISSLCREERYLVDWCERCNRTATHQLSWCVTVISKAKEEMKMVNETRKILHNDEMRVTATTVRVPVFDCHSESINIEFEKPFEMDELLETLKNAPGVVLQNNSAANEYPLAVDAAGHDEVFIGRVRRDESVESGVNIWVVADNIRKGAATNAVQIAEEIIKNMQ